MAPQGVKITANWKQSVSEGWWWVKDASKHEDNRRYSKQSISGRVMISEERREKREASRSYPCRVSWIEADVEGTVDYKETWTAVIWMRKVWWCWKERKRKFWEGSRMLFGTIMRASEDCLTLVANHVLKPVINREILQTPLFFCYAQAIGKWVNAIIWAIHSEVLNLPLSVATAKVKKSFAASNSLSRLFE